jgi:hypothetical protein
VASVHAREESNANAAAVAAMGVDPATGAPNHVSYGGFEGIKTHYQEIYNSMVGLHKLNAVDQYACKRLVSTREPAER